ncbi:DUF6883 domain-containing protein [Microcoleus sp. bin38.metabat.b11b12b14.051]|uniref:DUF6883 domain-containing protein n=1 Tax=Microcoleus sp. bin38.metabat.b11b12b14.051 TaxID=2742709 RepID=UPI0025DFCDDF|nr:DUF6883 domain-containing protein [Microcoleus sp. bin38.metabat.b11b12b14.051]
MKLKEIVSHLVIAPQKLTEYALNLDNPVGSDKAVIFQRCLGFIRENHELLLAQISTKTLDAEAVLGLNDKHGQRYRTHLRYILRKSQKPGFYRYFSSPNPKTRRNPVSCPGRKSQKPG